LRSSRVGVGLPLDELTGKTPPVRRAAERSVARPDDWMGDGGEMGKVIRAMDWAATPLGAIDRWPQSLRTTVSLCVASNFPIALAWGPQHVQLYNDGYWPICGKKHPDAMGQDFSQCWASAWPVIGEAFERALTGETSYLENQRMFLDRNGYLEETFFTFSFSPIRDESGGVGGLFHPVTETTSRMLSARRTRTLRELTLRATKAKSTEEALVLCAQTLAAGDLDVAFSLIYLVAADGASARLVARNGVADGAACAPDTVDLRAPVGDLATPSAWPLGEVMRRRATVQVDDVRGFAGPLIAGPYPEPPKTVLLLPILPPGAERPVAILVAGASARLPFTENYAAYVDLVAASVTTAVANARAHEEERRRSEALAEIDRAKTAFFSNVSHEFRTPLTLMLGPLEDELDERIAPLPPARRARLEAAHRNTLRLLRLVNTLLDFARVEAGRVQASYEPTDLAVFTTELASLFRSAIERAGMTLTMECDGLGEPIYVDREMWEKIVLNLLSNAFKHTFEGGIRVALRLRGGFAELAVSDTGVGVPPGELPRLFDRFHRVKGARSRSHEGTGIGLALVQELVRTHGGEIHVQSRVGVGTTFTVSAKTGRDHLPADRVVAARAPGPATATSANAYVQEALQWLPSAAAVPPSSPSAAAAAASPVATHGEGAAVAVASVRHGEGRPRVIWADDNADMRAYVSRLLADSYDVLAVADGAAALAAAKAHPPDLVLSDVMMPELDGFGLLRELRADPRTRIIPVILLSARAGEEASVEGLAAGADDYLVKPFSARELLARVRTHVDLARLRREWSAQLQQANQELEAFSYSVSHDLRAPLRAIDGFSKAVMTSQGDRLDEQARGQLQRVRAAAGRMSILIDDLLALSRITRHVLVREATDLSAIANALVGDLRHQHPDRRVEVAIEPGLSAQADARLMRVVLDNLIGNAWKFTAKRAGAQIWFGAVARQGPRAFVVRDNGAGFDQTYAKQLFRAFQRLHTVAEFEGTGIGLATVARVVGRHGGRVWAESEVDKGASFFFTLESEP
jgi:signal transduction histidine kinase